VAHIIVGNTADQASLLLVKNDGTGNFTTVQTLPTGGRWSYEDKQMTSSIAVADMNSDGRLDLVIVSMEPNEILYNDVPNPRGFRVDQDVLPQEVFTRDVAVGDVNEAGDVLTMSIAVADINGDYLPDIVLGSLPTRLLLLNNASYTGTFDVKQIPGSSR